jgi:hypothetical protein
MEEPTKITVESLQSELKTLQLDFIRIKNDWIIMEKRLSDKLYDIIGFAGKQKPADNRIGGFTVAELAKLKALGLLPKDLLTKAPLNNNEEAQKNKDGTSGVR